MVANSGAHGWVTQLKLLPEESAVEQRPHDIGLKKLGPASAPLS